MRAWLLLFLTPCLLAQSGLLERALGNEARQGKERESYFYREHAEHLRPNGQRNFTQDYEWVYLEGEPFRRMVARNGKPLKGRLARDEAERLRMTAAERRAHARKPNPRVIQVGNLSGKVILTEMDHTQLADEQIDGRKVWVIRAEPKPGRESIAYRMTFWIDQEDTVLARVKYEVIAHGTDSLPGTWSLATYTRHEPGLWFKTRVEGEFYTGPPRPRSHWRQIHVFKDFRKFDAESTITFVPQ